jgi:hypothetical protein
VEAPAEPRTIEPADAEIVEVDVPEELAGIVIDAPAPIAAVDPDGRDRAEAETRPEVPRRRWVAPAPASHTPVLGTLARLEPAIELAGPDATDPMPGVLVTPSPVASSAESIEEPRPEPSPARTIVTNAEVEVLAELEGDRDVGASDRTPRPEDASSGVRPVAAVPAAFAAGPTPSDDGFVSVAEAVEPARYDADGLTPLGPPAFLRPAPHRAPFSSEPPQSIADARSDVGDLISRFAVLDADGAGELGRELKAMAGLEPTPPAATASGAPSRLPRAPKKKIRAA